MFFLICAGALAEVVEMGYLLVASIAQLYGFMTGAVRGIADANPRLVLLTVVCGICRV